MNFIDLLICGLATWRIASIITQERIFENFRTKLTGVRVDPEFAPDTLSLWAYLWHCVWCMSVWVGAGVVLVYHFIPEVTYPFVVSALSIMTTEIIERLQIG
jgi:hypothetical protein